MDTGSPIFPNGVRRDFIVTPKPFEYLDLLGKEFEWGGRGPSTYDCYGLVIEARGRAGKFMPEDCLSTDQPACIDSGIHDAITRCRFTELSGPRPFCLVTFRIHPRFTTHIGMVLEDNVRFIHILRKMRVGVERLDSPEWARRITGFWETI
jgi:murein DD-endopeptidase